MDTIIFMKSENFEFLRPESDLLANLGALAEAVLHIDPGSALTRLRGFAEELTKAIYKKEEVLPRLPQSTFYELIKNPVFESCINKSLVAALLSQAIFLLRTLFALQLRSVHLG
jgi:type I restriction enzyme R subunit